MSGRDAILLIGLGLAAYAAWRFTQPADAALVGSNGLPAVNYGTTFGPPAPIAGAVDYGQQFGPDISLAPQPDPLQLGISMLDQTQPDFYTGGAGTFLVAPQQSILSMLNSANGAVNMSSKISLQDVFSLANKIVQTNGFAVSPEVATAIAVVESGSVSNPNLGCDPQAHRYEAALGDTSAGLMQTLSRTANWLYSLEYNRYGIGNLQSLYDAETSMYFGCAYLDYLSRYKGQQRSLEFIVQSYNAGPGHPSAAYLAKFNQAYLTIIGEENT